MNGLEEIQENIKKFICEKEQVQKQIAEIEEKRTQLAQQRNEKKKSNTSNNTEVDELGKQISELGNQSQELQNKLDFKSHEIKVQVGLSIDNLVVEGIRKIRKINEEIQELEQKNASQKERNAKYEIQKQEFYIRFGRMPELSENAIRENKHQEEETIRNTVKIKELEVQIKQIEEEIADFATTKKELKNGNWDFIINPGEEIYIEEISVEGLEPIEEFYVEEFEPIGELYIEEFRPIEEIHIEEIQVEEFKMAEGVQTQSVEKIETVEVEAKMPESSTDVIEELARAIVEEIAEEQAQSAKTNKIEEDIITFEEKTSKKGKIIIPLFGQKAVISTIIVKIEEGELIYKAQMSDGEEIKISPSKISEENVLLRDKQNREECEEILINYAGIQRRAFDKKVISKIDPLVCELLIECAEEYDYDAQELIYSYAMSFSKSRETYIVPVIIYNLSYIKESYLSKKEKSIINKICKNARKNNNIEIIESFTGIKKIKYILKKIFAVNNVKVLPEAKY